MDGFTLELLEFLKKMEFPFVVNSRSFIDNGYGRFLMETYNFNPRHQKDFNLVINPACFLNQFEIDNKTIIFTVWDSTVVPKEYCDVINNARLLIVPSKFIGRCFRKSGVEIPIEVIPHGFSEEFNTVAFNYVLQPKRTYYDKCVFGASGQIVIDKNDKKNLDLVISCFQKAFSNGEEVELHLKVTKDSVFDGNHPDSRIKISKSDFTKLELANWYRKLSCFVNLSAFEAFGRQPLEAMASGIPIITSNWSGISEYYKDDFGYTVGYDTYQCYSGIYKEGFWSQPNEDEVISRM